jgi:hypothetical protein
MKYFFCLLIFAILLPEYSNTWSQENPGAPPNLPPYISKSTQAGVNKFFVPEHVTADSFATSVYTFGNITIFSYFNNTQVKVYSQAGALIGSATLKADTLYNLLYLSAGIYRIVGNISYTVLVGDAITSYVNGYYAVDQSGRGVATKLNTWMMSAFQSDQDEFAIFAYSDNTTFTVKNLVSGNIIRAGTLNSGQHYSFRENGGIPYSTPIQVVASKGVSVLSYTDQDYYVPSSTGLFTGTLFLGYSAYEGAWENSITVTSYADNNTVNIVNSNTGASLGSFTMGRGQVKTVGIFAPTFWTVTSTGQVSAANIPYAGWTGSYYYMARSIDSTGVGAGKLFFVPTISSRIDVFSFDNSNSVKITQLGLLTDYPYTTTSTVVYTGTLNSDQNYNFTSLSGDYVYKIEGTGNLSVLQSNGGAGADFMPLSYALSLPDLAVSNADILFSVPDSVYVAGDQITVTAKVHNQGTVGVANVQVAAYDGDPDLGLAPLLATGTIPSINANDSSSFSFPYIIPINPQYRSIVIKVDPNNLTVESNKSNNKASRFLRPNMDLLPPLAVNVTAPSGLTLVSSLPSPNPFTVKFDIFNTGTVTATNAKLALSVKNGLKLLSGITDTTVNFGSILANQSVSFTVLINVNKDSSGFNFYSANVSADNAALKAVSRAINVPDGIPPAAPKMLTGSSNSANSATVTWKANTESDLAGYMVYYTTDSTNYSQNAPIVVVSLTTLTLSGLTGTSTGVVYFFKLKAYDTSNNLSGFSNQVSALVKNVTDVNDLPSGQPEGYSLLQNYPNPFNPSTRIVYSVPFESNVKLSVYNSLGQIIRELFSGTRSAGYYDVYFDATSLSSGVYFYRMEARSISNDKIYSDIKKMIFIK